MDKINLIKKEIKDCKLYLNYLYDCLKSSNDNDEINRVNYEIDAVSYTKDILNNLASEYDKGNGDIELSNITNCNELEFLKFFPLKKELSDSDLQDFVNFKTLKNSLDFINENFLTKDEIYEYLNDYSEVMKIANKNVNMSIRTAFHTYMMKTNQSSKNNYSYYSKMIKIHILFVNTGILAITKDEDFEHLWANDAEMGEKTKNDDLSFLKDKFIIPTDSTRFKKTHIFNFIRNSFCHSDSNELYKITPNCDFITISLKKTNPVPFNVKIHANDIYRLVRNIRNYSHHVTAFELENQNNININNLFGNYYKCSNELDGVSLVRKKLDDNITARKEDINKALSGEGVKFSTEKFNNVISSYGNVTEIKYNFSEDQKKLFYDKFNYFNKYLSNMDMKYFINPIIFNYMAGGIHKLNFLNFDAAIGYVYLFNWNNSILDIMSDVSLDYARISGMGSLPNNKDSVFNYIGTNIDDNKYGYLYLFDDMERENYNSIMLFNYVFGSMNGDSIINIGGIDYPADRIRNAFTHGRWRGFLNQDGKRCFYLYDDEDLLVNPDKATWSNTFLEDDLRDAMNRVVDDYKKNNSNIKVKVKK